MKFLSKFSVSLILTTLVAAGIEVRSACAQTPPTNPPRPVRVRAKVEGFDLSSHAGKSSNQIGGASRDLGTPAL